MNNKVLLGLWRMMIPIPGMVWQREAFEVAKQTVARIGFMSEEHHLIRDFVVRELPCVGEPLAPEVIAQEVGLRRERVVSLLDEMERNMTFLFRNATGAVTWAYPVTVDRTPHRVTFSTGEQIYAA